MVPLQYLRRDNLLEAVGGLFERQATVLVVPLVGQRAVYPAQTSDQWEIASFVLPGAPGRSLRGLYYFAAAHHGLVIIIVNLACALV